MTLSNFQDHSPIASFLKCNFSYRRVAVDKISTDTVRRAVSASRGLSAIIEHLVKQCDQFAKPNLALIKSYHIRHLKTSELAVVSVGNLYYMSYIISTCMCNCVPQ